MRYIVAYDIAHPRRLNRIAKVLCDYGFRIQKSIFEVELEVWQLQELQKRIASIMEPVEDGVKYFRVCGRCIGPWYGIGMTLNVEWTKSYLIV